MYTFSSPYLDENVMIKAPFVISEGTLNSFDVVTELSQFLTQIEKESGHPYPGNHGIPVDALENENHLFWESEECFDLWQELLDNIQDYAPPFCIAGSIEGDGACIGVFPEIEAAHECLNDEYKVFTDHKDDDHDPEPGLWLHVNDHGNATLFHRDDHGNDTELWAVV